LVNANEAAERSRPLLPRVRGLLYGGDYNPEQWPEETWLEDVALMREAHVNLVSVGIFSWALLEPEPGVYDFGWLDRVIDLLWSNGIAVDLATPTAAPPAWLVREHPEVLPVTRDGVRLEFGSRRTYCPSSPIFREATVKLAEQLARHYGGHPAVAMWHVSNEYGCHLTACYCPTSAEDFRAWLQARYGEIEALNRAWGTAAWGQRYRNWSEIEPPRRTPASINPSQALDWARFSSDALLACYEAERQVLTELAPGIPVTTNFMNTFQPADYWKWAGREDVVTLDSYPDPSDPDAHLSAALNYDLMRSLGGGQPWLLLEHAVSAVNWREVNVPKRPGLMRLWAYQALAHGSDGIMFFQWRAARAAAEKFHSAMVPHGGKETRGWEETARLGSELAALEQIAGSTTHADVALVFGWDNWWAFDGGDHPSQRLDLPTIVLDWYRPFFESNVPVDVVPPAGDLAGYRLVVAPNLYLLTDEALDALTAFVREGGVFVCGFFSGVVDENDHVRSPAQSAALRRLLGVRVDEFWPIPPGEEIAVELVSGESAVARDWSEWLEPDGGEPVAHYSSGVLAGRPAVIRNTVDAGTVYYCSAGLDATGLASIVRSACKDAAVHPVADVPTGVEACRRSSESGSYLFLLNHTEREVYVELPGTAELVLGMIPLEPLGVAVVRERPPGEP
jgi:beta-galactosidase